MPGHRPEYKSQNRYKNRNDDRDPDRSSQQQIPHIWFSNRQCSKRRRFRLTEKDKDRVEFVLMGDEEKNCKSEWDEELSRERGEWQRHRKERRLTKKRLDLGCTSRKMREKPTAKPIQRIIRPRMRRTRADMGVRLPNALDRRNLGKASCSMALKQYSFWEWNISGIWASMLSSSWVLGSSWLLRGKVWILKAGGK